MKILVFTHRTNFSGGANRSLLSVLIGLKNKGHYVKVILPRKNGELNNELTKENIDWDWCRYYRMGAKPYFKGILKPIGSLILIGKYIHHYLASKKVLKKIKNEKYDIVYTNTILPYVGIFVAKNLNLPSVIHDREPLDGTNIPQLKNYEQFIYNNCNRVIVISKDLQNQWKKRNLTEKITLINNGIPKSDVVRSSQDIKENLNILLTARLSPTKHHRDALEALLILKNKKINNIKLFFAGSEGEKGDTSYKEELQKYINDNKLSENVEFLGEVENMIDLRSKMHIELMCNPNEPFGRVTVEGMRSGLIVIGVNAGGTKDIIIDNINGLFYKENDINDLAQKIEKIYKDSNFRRELADSAFDYGNSNFTMEENVNRIEKVLFEELK